MRKMRQAGSRVTAITWARIVVVTSGAPARGQRTSSGAEQAETPRAASENAAGPRRAPGSRDGLTPRDGGRYGAGRDIHRPAATEYPAP
jgi:hypothetical protein